MNSKFLGIQLSELNHGVAQSNNAGQKTSNFHVSPSQDLRGQVQMLAGGTTVILIWPLFSSAPKYLHLSQVSFRDSLGFIQCS